MTQPAFRLSLNGHYKLNTEAEAEIEKMRINNTNLLKKMKYANYAMNALPLLIFFVCFPIAALVSFALQLHIEKTFYVVAPVLLISMYACMKKLTAYQESCKQKVETNINDTVRETEEIIFRSPEPINETNCVEEEKPEATTESINLKDELEKVDETTESEK